MAAVLRFPPAMPITRRTRASSCSSMAMTRSLSGVIDRRAGGVEEPQADVADGATVAQRLQLLRREDVAARRQQLRGLHGADADEGDRDRLEERRGFLDVAILEHHAPGVGGPDRARRRQQRRRAGHHVRQPARQLRGMDFSARIADAAENLDHACARGPGTRMHRFHHRQQRRTPRRDADDIRGLERRLEVERGGGAEVAHDLVFLIDRVDDDRLAQPVGRLQRVLELGMKARRHAQRDADDAFLLGAPQQSRHRGLMDVEPLGDLGLTQARAVVEARDLRHEPQLVEPGHLLTFP